MWNAQRWRFVIMAGQNCPKKLLFRGLRCLQHWAPITKLGRNGLRQKKLSVTLFWCQIRMWFPVQVLWSTEVSKCFDFDSGCLYILYYIKCVSYICSYLLIFLHISCVSVSLRSSARSRRAAEMTTYFARPYDMKAGTLKDRLCAASPTLMLAVPLVWEKTLSKVWENLWKSLSCLALTLKHHKKTLKMNYSET